jgi:hypothetical protein
MNWNRRRGAGLLLHDGDHAARNVGAAHFHDIAAPLQLRDNAMALLKKAVGTMTGRATAL